MLSQLLAHLDLTGFSLFSAILFALVASVSALSLAGKVDTMERKITMLQAQINERIIDLDRLDKYYPPAEETGEVAEVIEKHVAPTSAPAVSQVSAYDNKEGIFKQQLGT